jgi:hypothetical protein
MNETQLSQEAYEVVDSTSFSAVAVVAFLASLVGIFSIKYVQPMPLAIIGSAMGAFVLLTAKMWNLNLLSKILGALAVIIGVTVLSWGLFERSLHTNSELTQAKKVAQLYLDALSAGDLDSVYYLVGFQYEPEKPKMGDEEPETELQKAKRRLAQDATHVEIQKRRDPAKWVFVSLEGETIGTAGYSYKLKFRDEGQTNPPSYWVYARKDATRYEVRDLVRWYVDNVEPAK